MDRPEQKRDAALPPADEAEALTPFEAGIGAGPSDVQRVSDRTNVHDAGSDANDTEDGLTESEEAVRQAAEDVPTGADPAAPRDSIPVFDRASLPPRV
ncbi:hypothetical protein [Bosea sp. (in: a-proteobacteria)]|uniref:hypothetical protein n=1 Tax=Bosea sp. (in: a-proteobacteria) TaxID=1871050 RepID=UPI00122C0549|nr:hypothetical protein [Bosea sp. (in: a-proteobacteria)]TAJ27792.1 MAG: hypothetical protein EPO59_20765 [Bosea sp. (in: a-proteobacteria)]